MRVLTRLLATSTLLVLALAALASATAGASQTSRTVGHLYVNDNTAGANTIAGFARHADGTLTALPGSPFSAGGAGSGAPVASQGSLQQSADGRFLLATDQASNQISVLRIRADGSLVPVDLGASGGVQPVSIAVHGPLVYVANAGAGGSSYSGFAAAYGYDPIGTLRATEHVYRHSVASVRPYAFWVAGSPVAWGVMLGLPIAAAALRSCVRRNDAAVALAVVVVVAAVAGFTKAETERIWLFFVPLACVAAAPAITSRRTTAVIAALVAQALAIEVLFDTIW